MYSKSTSCLPHLKSWNYCIIGNVSRGECNNARARNYWSHLRMSIHPLPVHQIPKALLQLQCSSRTEQNSFPNLSTGLSLSNQLFEGHQLAFLTSKISPQGSMNGIAIGANMVRAVRRTTTMDSHTEGDALLP